MPSRGRSGSHKSRERQLIINDTLRRVPDTGTAGPAGPAGPPGAPGGVTSYNGRVGVVVSVIGDIVAHKATHENGGADEPSVAGLSGLLADGQTPLAHAGSHGNGGADEVSIAGLSGVAADPQPPIIGAGAAQAVAGNDARLTDARNPLAHVHVQGDVTGLVAALAAKEAIANKGVAGGYASLDGAAKIPQSQLPAIAITDTFVVGSQVAMLALVAETGDVAIRTDVTKNFILQGSDPTNLAHWQELLIPPDVVTSVNGETGAVSLVAADIPYSGAAGLAAADVEAALDELDAEKATPAQITADIAAHVALADPHVQYQKESEKGAASGYASLDAGTKVPAAQIPAEYITDAELAAELANYADTSHAATHQNGGTDEILVAGLSGQLADDQPVIVHDILTKHNGFPGGATFLRADGTWAAPPGGAAADPTFSPGSFTVVTETQRLGPHRLKMTGAQRITIEGTGRLSCLE